jgi:hypothetical protein
MSDPEFQILDFEWGMILEHDFNIYMANCEESLEEDILNQIEFDEDNEWIKDSFTITLSTNFETLSGQPFCGCDTCYTREQLYFLVPRIIKAYKEGKITLTEDFKKEPNEE